MPIPNPSPSLPSPVLFGNRKFSETLLYNLKKYSTLYHPQKSPIFSLPHWDDYQIRMPNCLAWLTQHTLGLMRVQHPPPKPLLLHGTSLSSRWLSATQVLQVGNSNSYLPSQLCSPPLIVCVIYWRVLPPHPKPFTSKPQAGWIGNCPPSLPTPSHFSSTMSLPVFLYFTPSTKTLP